MKINYKYTVIPVVIVAMSSCVAYASVPVNMKQYVVTSKVERVTWHIPEDWYAEPGSIVYNQVLLGSAVVESTSTDVLPNNNNNNNKFDPNYIIQTTDDNLIDYAQDMNNAIYRNYTNISSNYTDKSVPDLAIDAKTYERFQQFGYNRWNKQCYLSRGSYAYTGDYNLRMVDGRYLIALGTYYTSTIGTYVDVVLENGTVLACILGDIKSDLHTNETHQYQRWDKSVIEFIVDSPAQNGDRYHVMRQYGGNMSNVECFNSRVVSIRVYDKVFPIVMGDISNDNPD